MNLSCVRTKCSDCGIEAYRSAGVVARALGRSLTEMTAAMVPRVIGCLNCGSNLVDVFEAHGNSAIVTVGKTPLCRICENHIPEPFLRSFPLADFCPICVAEGQVADARVVAAYGELIAKYGASVAGEAYRFMAMRFDDDEGLRLKWLRKAAHEGDINACSSLGDYLSRSDDTADLADAASFYERVVREAKPRSSSGYAANRLAWMLLAGRGCAADSERAVQLMLTAGDCGKAYSFADLGRLYCRGEYGLAADPAFSFQLYRKAFDMQPDSMSTSAAVALMMLSGMGTAVDVDEGAKALQHAISVFGKDRRDFDQETVFTEIMAARETDVGQTADMPKARFYLNWMAGLKVPGAPPDLLARCGGPLPPYEPRWQLSLSRALPDKVKGDIWSVHSPLRDWIGQPTILGQVEKMPTHRWIATTKSGVPVGDSFASKEKAVEALVAALDCDIPYIQPLHGPLHR